jgi:hypothetical protein
LGTDQEFVKSITSQVSRLPRERRIETARARTFNIEPAGACALAVDGMEERQVLQNPC